MTLPPAGRVLSRQHHALTQRTRVLIADQPIGRIAVLDQPGRPGFIAAVDPGAVDRQVGEEEHVTGPGRQRDSRLERDVGQMKAPARVVLERPLEMAAGDDPDAASFFRDVVEVEDRRADPVQGVRKNG